MDGTYGGSDGCPNVSGMRRTSRLLTFSALCAALLVGCTPEAAPTPSPSSSTEPVFASDEEALAAAEATYREFLAAVDEISHDGGLAPERVERFLSADLFDNESTGYQRLRDNAWVGTGRISFSMTIREFSDEFIDVYVCEDYSATDVLNREGQSVIRADGPTLWPFEVRFDVQDELRIIKRDDWLAGGVC